jgi:ABC-type oligopeptide transport system substrate-binding subunit
MQSKNLRQGLAFGIDREKILRDIFRAGKPEFHKEMTGPFPPGTWAVARGPAGPESLLYRDKALLRLRAYLSDPAAHEEIKLAYPEEDPKAALVCIEIKKQIEALLKDEPPNAKKLSINPVAMPLNDLLSKVQYAHKGYQFAYIPFDYPDDWYPYALGAALDPEAAGNNGRNWFSFETGEARPDPADQALGRALKTIRLNRDFAGEIVPQTHTISRLFNDSLPFIPLWQLDRHMVVSRKVKIVVDDNTEVINPKFLNQTILFQGVGRWKVE